MVSSPLAAAAGITPSASPQRRTSGWKTGGADLLPVEYFHLVFTLPAPVAAIAYHNKAVVFAMPFKAAAETLESIAPDKRHLGAEIGAIMVLHTWGQTLTHHPHVALHRARRRAITCMARQSG